MARASINGVTYNTNRGADKLGVMKNCGVPYNDSRWFSEELYRKKTGEFFIYGRGKSMSPYREGEDTGIKDVREQIVAVSEDRAKEWASTNLDSKAYDNMLRMIDMIPTPVVTEKKPLAHKQFVDNAEAVKSIISAIQDDPTVTQPQLAEISSISKANVVIVLNTLREDGKLTREGSRRSGRWILSSDLMKRVGSHQKPQRKHQEDDIQAKSAAEIVRRPQTASVAVTDDDRVGMIVDVLRKTSEASQRTIAAETGISLPKVNAIMQQLVADGRVIREGTAHRGRYIVKDIKKPAMSEDNKSTVIDVIRERPDITQRELAKSTGISLPKVNHILQTLNADGVIIREGTSRKGTWVILSDAGSAEEKKHRGGAHSKIAGKEDIVIEAIRRNPSIT